jgi:hypothetical protein
MFLFSFATMDTSSLQWDIAYALARHQKLLPKRGKRPTSWPPGHDEFAYIAGKIVEHIERSGWEVRRKPPRPL